jgi:hypothetical protein
VGGWLEQRLARSELLIESSKTEASHGEVKLDTESHPKKVWDRPLPYLVAVVGENRCRERAAFRIPGGVDTVQALGRAIEQL